MPIRPRYADLFGTLNDPDPIRADAAFDAVLFDRAEALPDLHQLYLNSARYPRLRYLAIQLMGFSDDKRAIPLIIPAMDDHDPVVRAEACRALGDLRASDTADVLRAHLDDLDPGVREAAGDTLRILGFRR